jgi:pyruvate,water dikinase
MNIDNLILIPLESEYCDKLGLVGGKAYKLAILKKKGFLVPGGHILTTIAFDKFVNQNSFNFNSLSRDKINEKDFIIPAEVEIALRKIEEKNLGKLIVRSSAVSEDSKTLSFAGLYESVPNVKSYEELKKAVIHCWLAAFSDRISAYIKSAGIGNNPKLALLIQEFIEPESAGVVFSVNPENGETDEIVINSVKGFAGELLSGKQEGDEWVYKNGGAICIKEPFKSLTLKQVHKIAETARDIEKYFSEPQDIEWAIKDEQIYIVQSRPITHIGERKKYYYFQNIPVSNDLILLYPYPQKPFDFYFLKEIMETAQYSIASIYGWQYSLGLRRIRNFTYIEDKSKIKSEEVPFEFQQNLYFAMDLIIGKNKELIKRASSISEEILKSSKKITSRKQIQALLEENWLKWKDIFDLHYLIANFAQAEIENFMYFIKEQVGIENIDQNNLYGLLSGKGNYQTRINNKLLKIGELLRKKPNILSNIENLGDDAEIIPRLKLLDSSITTLLEKLLKNNGKLMYSLNVSSESWIENPAPLLRLILRYAKEKNNKSNKENINKHRKKTLKYIEYKIGDDERKKELFRTKMDQAVLCNRVLQDRDVLIVNPAIYSAHEFFLKIGNVLVTSKQIAGSKDIFYLLPNEIREALVIPGINFKNIIERRKSEELFWSQIKPPFRISRNFVEENGSEKQKNTFYGVGLSGGKAKGKVLLINDFYAASMQMSKKKILIAHDFDLSWTPLFVMAEGIITEVDFGLLSHTAVLAREYGIPAVAGVQGIMEVATNDDLIEIDGDIGRIKILGS